MTAWRLESVGPLVVAGYTINLIGWATVSAIRALWRMPGRSRLSAATSTGDPAASATPYLICWNPPSRPAAERSPRVAEESSKSGSSAARYSSSLSGRRQPRVGSLEVACFGKASEKPPGRRRPTGSGGLCGEAQVGGRSDCNLGWHRVGRGPGPSAPRRDWRTSGGSLARTPDGAVAFPDRDRGRLRLSRPSLDRLPRRPSLSCDRTRPGARGRCLACWGIRKHSGCARLPACLGPWSPYDASLDASAEG
jgi:hypothetical protein